MASSPTDRPPRAVIRTTWSQTIGGGHLVRCLALADELAKRGWLVGFAAEATTDMPMPGGISYPIAYTECPDDDEPRFLAAKWPEGIDLLVVDHFQRDIIFEQACRPWARLILAIDGLKRSHDCDVLLDPVNARIDPDRNRQLPATCVKLLGPGYALLRPEFARRRQEGRARRAAGVAGNILISLGAFDPHGLTQLALRAVALARPDARTRVILGGSADRTPALRRLAAELGLDAIVNGWSADIVSALVESDIAIGAAGSAAWERCCLGVPSVAIIMADNQRPIADLLIKTGAALVVGDWQETGPEGIAAALKRLSDDPAFRNQVIESATALCDGAGTEHVASLVTRMLTETTGPAAKNVR